MKLSTLEDDEGLGVWFQRLIDSKPSQIVIFEPDMVPVKKEADVYFYFPCDDKKHKDCGFFYCVTAIMTSDLIFDDIENLRLERNLPEEEVELIMKDAQDWAFGINVRANNFNRFDVLKLTSDWIAEWVEELADVPVVLVDLHEHRRIWARYEEYHPHPEAVDIFFAAIRDANSAYIESPDGNVYTGHEFRELLRKMIDKANDKPEGTEDEQ